MHGLLKMTRGKVLRLEGTFMVLNLWTDDLSKYLWGSQKELLVTRNTTTVFNSDLVARMGFLVHWNVCCVPLPCSRRNTQ